MKLYICFFAESESLSSNDMPLHVHRLLPYFNQYLSYIRANYMITDLACTME
jgi:hypothetical protein